MKRKFSVGVNHFAAKTIDEITGSNKESLVTTFLILIFSGCMMYAGYRAHGLLMVLSGILFAASALILILEIFIIVKNVFSKDEDE